MGTNTLAPEPHSFQAQRTCLFLDVDGTLVDLQPRPEDVFIDDELIALLTRIHAQLQGALALISGRPIRELDNLFAPLHLPVAGIHGFERRSTHNVVHRPTVANAKLDIARDHLNSLVANQPDLLIEDKGAALALHYRSDPELADLAERCMQECDQMLGSEYELLEGDCVIELKPSLQNKATAIEAFMKEDPFAGRIPIYIGDDRTDFDGFGAVRRHAGVDIAVGDRVPARWRLENPAAVRSWLQRFAAQGEKQPRSASA